MPVDERTKQAAQAHLKRAQDFLNLGQLVLANGYNQAAVAQGYFAVHHGVAAALYSMGKRPRSHAEFQELFQKVLVPTGKFSDEDASTFEDFLEQRKKSDYSPVELHDAPYAMRALEVSGELVLRLESFVREMLEDSAPEPDAVGPSEEAKG
ncbi:MAG: HEPN domain-containing protein [Planctomycetota bacterium]